MNSFFFFCLRPLKTTRYKIAADKQLKGKGDKDPPTGHYSGGGGGGVFASVLWPGGSINVAQSGPELSIILIASQLVGKKARGQKLFEVTQHSQAEKVEEKNHLSSYLCVWVSQLNRTVS